MTQVKCSEEDIDDEMDGLSQSTEDGMREIMNSWKLLIWQE